jgi:cytochrome c oxidase subunit IV
MKNASMEQNSAAERKSRFSLFAYSRSTREIAYEIVAAVVVAGSAVYMFSVWPALPVRMPGLFGVFSQTDHWGARSYLLLLFVVILVCYVGYSWIYYRNPSGLTLWKNESTTMTILSLRHPLQREVRMHLSWERVSLEKMVICLILFLFMYAVVRSFGENSPNRVSFQMWFIPMYAFGRLVRLAQFFEGSQGLTR